MFVMDDSIEAGFRLVPFFYRPDEFVQPAHSIQFFAIAGPGGIKSRAQDID